MFGTQIRLDALRLAAAAAAGVLVVAGCSSPSKTPATSAPTSAVPTSSAATTPPPPSVPRVPEDRLGSFLLTVDEGNAIMGTSGMQDQGGLATLDTNAFAVSNPDCLGPAHIVQPPVYSDSGYTAVQFDVLHEPGPRYTHSIEQALTTFPSAEQAAAFVQTSAGKWKACAGQEISESLNFGTLHWTFGSLVGDPPKISMIMKRHNARGYTCQRVLSAVRNAVIDMKACAFNISDQGVQAADKVAAKATQ